MGQCVTISVGNEGAVVPLNSSDSGGGTNVSVGASGEEEEEEEEEEEGINGCIDDQNCFGCL